MVFGCAFGNEHCLELSSFGAMVGHEFWIGCAPVQIHVTTGFLFYVQSMRTEELGRLVNVFIFRKENASIVKSEVGDNRGNSLHLLFV